MQIDLNPFRFVVLQANTEEDHGRALRQVLKHSLCHGTRETSSRMNARKQLRSSSSVHSPRGRSSVHSRAGLALFRKGGASTSIEDFIEEQRKEFSIILIASPPVLGLAAAPEIAQTVDATIFVIEANRTSFAQARTAVKRLTHVGANVIGAVLTKYRALEAGSDYAYQYQYYQYGNDK